MKKWLSVGWIGGAALATAVAAAAMYLHDASAPAPAERANPDRGSTVWGRDYFPNVELTTHEGENVRFFDDMIEGKVVAINFIYTTCPDACPMETARMLEVHQLIGDDRMGKDVHFYSITIDPDHDTPEVLRQYVEDWEIGPGWTFLTGDEQDIILLRRKLGLYIEEIQGDDGRDHNLNLVVGNQATGRWMRKSPFENPYVLAKQIGGELHNWRIASKKKLDYEDAPELRSISKGESLFRTRCEACHTIGGGDIHELAARRIGPDLYKITEMRDRAWLERWIAEPDVMLEEQDPLAMTLLAKYRNVPMPNMQLNPLEVEVVLDFIDEASAAVDRERAISGG